MKFLIIIALIACTVIYLNRTYAYFYDFQGNHFITNSFYPQVTEFNKNDATESGKLVVLGDSLMAGTGSTDIKTSPAYLIAEDLASAEPLTLINMASPGAEIKDVLESQLPKAIEEKPDYAILMIGTNDVHERLSEKQFADYYNLIVTSLVKETSAKITLINIPYLGSDKILFPPWDSIADLRIRKFNDIISKIAMENNLTVVDLYGEFNLQFKDSSDLYSYDEFHPSDKGYALWANYINKFVVSH